MKPVAFEGANITIAKDQPEYLPLPARFHKDDSEGRVTFCWELSPEEIEVVKKTGRIWQTVLTFHNPLQPQLLEVDKPDFLGHEMSEWNPPEEV